MGILVFLRSRSTELMALFFLFSVWALNEQIHEGGPAKKYLNPPPEKMEYFHFGFRESMADSLWLRWIQDGDSCQTYGVEAAPISEISVSRPGLIENPRHKHCDFSWSGKMLDAITRLAPNFQMPYLAGASTLAILTEDYAGATLIYERAVKQFPKNWLLLYRAAFHYQFNLRDLGRAAELLLLAGENGAPYWVKSLAVRLYSEQGQYELALENLISYRESIKANGANEIAINEVDERIKDLQTRMRREH